MPLRFLNPNLHVVLVHYPLGVFVLGVVLELMGVLWRRSSLRTAARWMIVIGAFLSLPAATSGIAALVDVRGTYLNEAQGAKLRLHVIYMGIGSLLAVLCAVVGIGASDRWRKYLYLPLLLGVVAAWGAMVIGAYNAGESIFREGTAVEVNTALPTEIDISETLDYQTDIRPIIAGTCYHCHDSESKKGKLAMDSAVSFRKGGKKKGPKIIVPGKPLESELYDRIVRHRRSEGVMPEEKDPGVNEHLTKDQCELIYVWIAQGADFGTWKKDKDPDAAAAEPRAKIAKEEAANPSEPMVVAPKPHPDLKTAIETKNYDELMDFYGGGALQQHLILAGFAFSGAFLALAMAFRRLHSTTLAGEPHGPLPPTPPAASERRRVAEDVSMLRSVNPRAELVETPAVNHIPSGRVWLVTSTMVIATAGFGYWKVNGSASTFTQEGWNAFVEMMKSTDPAIKINRAAAHAILGAAFLLMVLNSAILAAIGSKKKILLTVFSILLVAVMAAQVWIGVLLTFQPGVNNASLFRFKTAEEFAAQRKANAKPKTEAPQTSPATTQSADPETSAAPALDPAAPKKAAVAFFKAMEAGDLAALRQTAVGTDAQFELVVDLGKTMAATKRYEAATVKKFGDVGTLGTQIRPGPAARVESQDLKIDGNKATLSENGNPVTHLVQEASGWKVDLNEMNPKMEAMGKAAKRIAAAIDAVTKKVETGKYDTSADAITDYAEATKPQ